MNAHRNRGVPRILTASMKFDCRRLIQRACELSVRVSASLRVPLRQSFKGPSLPASALPGAL